LPASVAGEELCCFRLGMANVVYFIDYRRRRGRWHALPGQGLTVRNIR
jgi:hypothetical protein